MSESTAISSAEFERLFRQYKSVFVAIASSYVHERMVAEDLVTDSFLLFWNKRTEVTDDNLPAYILTIVKHKCLSYLRSESQHQRVHENIALQWRNIQQATILSLEHSDPKSLFLSEVESIVSLQLEEMPTITRCIFLDHRYHNLTYKKIAEQHGLSINQVDFEIRKATRLLRIALKDYLPAFAIALITSSIHS